MIKKAVIILVGLGLSAGMTMAYQLKEPLPSHVLPTDASELREYLSKKNIADRFAVRARIFNTNKQIACEGAAEDSDLLERAKNIDLMPSDAVLVACEIDIAEKFRVALNSNDPEVFANGVDVWSQIRGEGDIKLSIDKYVLASIENYQIKKGYEANEPVNKIVLCFSQMGRRDELIRQLVKGNSQIEVSKYIQNVDAIYEAFKLMQ
jgi:hypothetical protein